MSSLIVLFPDRAQIEVMTSYDSSDSLMSVSGIRSMSVQTSCLLQKDINRTKKTSAHFVAHVNDTIREMIV